MRVDLPLVAIYADESCLGNGREGDNPGAAAGLIEYMNPDTKGLTRVDFWVSEPATTNNRMALRSVIEAFRAISRKGAKFRVVFTSDSQYLVKGMGGWVHSWMTRGWRRKAGTIENLELWHQAVEAVNGHQPEWRWVRGHQGHAQNEYANYLAVRAAREQRDSGGAAKSGFEEWLAQPRARGGAKVGEPARFPHDRAFNPARPFPAVAKPPLTL